MEFKEFAKHYIRMCKSCENSCLDCPIRSEFDIEIDSTNNCEEVSIKNYEKAEIIVQRWADEHPLVTNADKFKEIFGIDIEASEMHEGYAMIGDYFYKQHLNDSLEGWLYAEYKPPKESK